MKLQQIASDPHSQGLYFNWSLNVERRARVDEPLQQQLSLAGGGGIQPATYFDLLALQRQHQARLHEHSKHKK